MVGFSIPVQKNPWSVHAVLAGCAWVPGALGAGLLGERNAELSFDGHEVHRSR